MKKFEMTIHLIVEATDRGRAWAITEQIIDRHLRDMAQVRSCHELEDPDQWIAVNEPIKARS